MVLDRRAFGGQAGTSSRIENYLGFPTGISGTALMARAFNQAQKFGAEFSIPVEAVRLKDDSDERDAFRLRKRNIFLELRGVAPDIRTWRGVFHL